MFRFQCSACAEYLMRLTDAKGARAFEGAACTKQGCSGTYARAPKPPSTLVTESLDNGIMARRVERIADAERIYKERARNDTLKKKGIEPPAL